MFESKIDKLRNVVISTIDEKIRILKDDIYLNIAKESSRLDDLVNSVQTLSVRVGQVENFTTNPTDHGLNNQYNDQGVKGNTQPADPLNDNDVTVIVKNLPFTEGENLQDKVQQIIDSLGEVSSQISVVATKRLTTRFHNKPGLVKISFQSQDQKILILRNKHKLKDVGYYKHVYIQSSKSRIERFYGNYHKANRTELPQTGKFLKNRMNRLVILTILTWKLRTIRTTPGTVVLLDWDT
ncbi:unnamed protein product [Mytilus edulis]|uniref:Uncharacterized protein n=1 Tax=Mytilus edulis TaxID=6550 RepID=A0A8S3SB06_MYTED|nr:unnamed protein product [Mytilus edulis]